MREPNHTCRVCGAQYYACNACDKARSWRSVCDTPEHYQVYQVVTMYNRHMISSIEANSMLRTIPELSNILDIMEEHMKQIVNAILSNGE